MSQTEHTEPGGRPDGKAQPVAATESPAGDLEFDEAWEGAAGAAAGSRAADDAAGDTPGRPDAGAAPSFEDPSDR